MPINIELRAHEIHGHGHAKMIEVDQTTFDSTPGIVYDPDIYYIESIDTTTKSVEIWYWDTTYADGMGEMRAVAGNDYGVPGKGWMIDSTTIDTTWVKYVTGKFTKEQWVRLLELLKPPMKYDPHGHGLTAKGGISLRWLGEKTAKEVDSYEAEFDSVFEKAGK